jgi:hypothetical protein
VERLALGALRTQSVEREVQDSRARLARRLVASNATAP